MPQKSSPVAIRSATVAALGVPALFGFVGLFSTSSCGAPADDDPMMGTASVTGTDSTNTSTSTMTSTAPTMSGTMMPTATATSTGGMGGMGGDMPPPRSTTGPSYAATVAAMFQMKCTMTCHEPGGILGGPGGADPEVQLNLTTAAGYAQLTTVRSGQVPTMWLVGTSLDDSYLWHKLNNTQAMVGGKGAVMPFSGDPMTAEELAVVQAWIEGGATP